MKRRILQDIKIGIFAVCLIFSFVLTVLAFLPEGGALEVSEEFHASSVPVDLTKGTNQILAAGTLRNRSDSPVTVERLEIGVKGMDQPLSSDAVTIPPRTGIPLTVSVLSEGSADRVVSVRVTVNGKTRELRNPAVKNALAYAGIPLILTFLFAILTAHAAIVRYYLHQRNKA